MKFMPKVRAIVIYWLIGIGLIVTAVIVRAQPVLDPIEPVTEKFQISYWEMTDTYGCKGKFPDGSTFDLKSKDDLKYTEWRAKMQTAWEASQEPPDLTILHETDDYAIRDPNDGNLVLEWKVDDVRVTVTKKNLPGLVDSTARMNDIFAGM